MDMKHAYYIVIQIEGPTNALEGPKERPKLTPSPLFGFGLDRQVGRARLFGIVECT